MSEMIPFGKYKGQPIEVLEHDPQYADWLAQQDWVKDRYPQIVNIIINKFGENEETPDHNAMQAKFMDRRYCALAADAIGIFEPGTRWPQVIGIGLSRELPGKPPSVLTDASQLVCEMIHFERNAIDVTFAALYPGVDEIRWAVIKAELKPIIGDDYPAVLRQMRNNGSNTLVYGSYIGQGIDEPTFRKFFVTQKIRVVKESEIMDDATTREVLAIEKVKRLWRVTAGGSAVSE
jgi:hypothetical protein